MKTPKITPQKIGTKTSVLFPLEKIIPITRARREFFTLTDNVLKKSSRYIITDHGSPKAALLPIRDALGIFESTFAAGMPGGASITADMSRKHSPWSIHFPSYFVADGSRDAVRMGATGASTKDIVRAQLAVCLIEQSGYPQDRIVIGCSVPASNNRFIEADVLVHDGAGHALAIFIVTEAPQFDDNRERALDDLFALVESLRAQDQLRLRLAGYYTRRSARGKSPKERMLLIDCRTYPTRQAWKSANLPTLASIPLYAALSKS